MSSIKKVPKFRSGFERKVYEQAKRQRKSLDFERSDTKLKYTRLCVYLPDFSLPNGVLVETKGRFTAPDRTKLLRVRDQNPEADIRLVFQRANNRLTKAKNSITYWEWAERHNFPWAEGSIPLEWWRE